MIQGPFYSAMTHDRPFWPQLMKSLTSKNFGSEGMHASAGMAAATPALFVPNAKGWKEIKRGLDSFRL